MKFLKSVLSRFNRYMTYMGRVKAREVLLRSSDRLLEDVGISRELLEIGVKAWPWHQPEWSLPSLNFNQSDEATAVIVLQNHSDMDDATAMRELQRYSDKELHDLGISRSAIPEAVIFGRDGIDNDSDRKVA